MKFLTALALWCLATSATAHVTKRNADSVSMSSHDPDDLPKITSIPPPTPINGEESRKKKSGHEEGNVHGYASLMTKCNKRCLSKSMALMAGCGDKDWDCLCRRGHLAPEIRMCIRNRCPNSEHILSLNALEVSICQNLDSSKGDGEDH
ncbi:hypothetical protein B0T19DRAFT_445968 [Cercophora scortea]|uniref:CFEM domain-containing protein n=1 Tax=Cercophora scortea TaxID=314031 RepID=A0AAE0M5X2_9PEZI|nr:hypothetical protein B0T19DRAFT_445968 [Cercophora scortea]